MRKIILSLVLFFFLVSVASAATLTVNPKDAHAYKTIQKAVNGAKDGDTISVVAGTYKEKVIVNDKNLKFVGQKGKYPTVYGFKFGWTADSSKVGSGDINGFKITKYGVEYGVVGGNTVRNNYFYNCGISGGGFTCSENTFMNNQFSGNYDYTGIQLYESLDNVITGNTFSKAKIGLSIWGGMTTCKKISGNTFSNCKIGVYCSYIPDSLLGNKYIKNKVNIKVVPEI